MRSRRSGFISIVALSMLLTVQLLLVPGFAVTSFTYGDQSIEPATSTIAGDMVQAFVRITITQPIVIQSVSLYLQYSGSDGSQCIKFGVYKDDPLGSVSPRGQLLVAATQNGYCLHGSLSLGPTWMSWNLLSSDYLTITSPGTYWLCTLAKQTFGTIYHYTTGPVYSNDYGSFIRYYNYTYGYNNYAFYSPYVQGFPGNFSSSPAVQANAPYSFYVTGVAP